VSGIEKKITNRVMRVLLQRVSYARVTVKEKVIGNISSGLLIFIAFCNEDNIEDIKWATNKIINLRIFDDDKKKMNYNLLKKKGEVLIISQFTLFGNVKKGNRPSWNKAAPSNKAEDLYNMFIEYFKSLYDTKKVQTGSFGENMQISLNNNGPVTIFFDSKTEQI